MKNKDIKLSPIKTDNYEGSIAKAIKDISNNTWSTIINSENPAKADLQFVFFKKSNIIFKKIRIKID